MSNQFRIEQDRDVICLIDTGRLMASTILGRTRLDAAVDAAASLAAVADTLGDRIGVVAFDSRIRTAMHPRRDGGRHVLSQIHDLEPRLVDSDFSTAFRSILNRKRAFVIVLTDIIDLSAARPLVEAVPVLTRKHSLAVASVLDPDIEASLHRAGASKPDLMRAAVAVKLLEDKEKAVAALRHRGAQVVEGPIDEYSVLCVSAYLRAKRYARL